MPEALRADVSGIGSRCLPVSVAARHRRAGQVALGTVTGTVGGALGSALTGNPSTAVGAGFGAAGNAVTGGAI